jgi:peptidoglycan/xylan/chitin deacetylase (PgdA/CDA1 family)
MSDRAAKLLSPLLYATGWYGRRWRSPGRRGAGLVMVYHRIAARGGGGEPPGYGVECGLPLEVFEAQLRFLVRHFEPASARQIAGETGDGERPRFAITFDDGYADNLNLAAPVLERLGLSATLFVNSGMVGSDRCFWWEQLGGLLREARVQQVDVASAAAELLQRWPMPPVLPLRDDAARARAHWTLSMAFMRIPEARIAPLLAALATATDTRLKREERDAPLLDWQQLREWRRRGFDLGAHGATHANLGLADAGEAEREVQECVERIAAESDGPVDLFAFPYGGPEHRSPVAVEAIRRAGCKAAFTTEPGVVLPEGERYALPRVGYTRASRFACAYQTESAFRISAERRRAG